MTKTPTLSVLALICAAVLFSCSKKDKKPVPQNPSPMAETTRAHERIEPRDFAGLNFETDGILSKPVNVFMPERSFEAPAFDLLIHFHGAHYLVQHAAEKIAEDVIAVTVNLGAGSKVYNDAFSDSTAFPALISASGEAIKARIGRDISIRNVILTAFSAGYGAVRRILSTSDNYRRVSAVLLLDGIHADYVPEGLLLAQGATVDSSDVAAFLKFAMAAASSNSKKRFLITHSEIFPGTYASTTEVADFILVRLDCSREAVLEWGPLGMQQLSRAGKNHFAVLGFAGNTAPDHVDHIHGMYFFVDLLMKQ
ncbi:MAG: hypothetical protein V3U73_10365 [bacterium]